MFYTTTTIIIQRDVTNIGWRLCMHAYACMHLPVSQRHVIITPLDEEVKSWCDGREELQAGLQPHFRLQGSRAVGIGTACRFPTGKQLDASWTVGISKTSFDWDCVASGHLWPSQLHGQARGNASRSSWSQCRVRRCGSWCPVVTTGVHIWHHWISTQLDKLDKILPLGPDAASDIQRTAVCRHEVDLRCPTRFRAWTSSVPSLHSRIAGYHQEGGHEGSLVCRWYTSSSQHWSLGCADSCPTVCQLHGEN